MDTFTGDIYALVDKPPSPDSDTVIVISLSFFLNLRMLADISSTTSALILSYNSISIVLLDTNLS
jgi:hypothetical protein